MKRHAARILHAHAYGDYAPASSPERWLAVTLLVDAVLAGAFDLAVEIAHDLRDLCGYHLPRREAVLRAALVDAARRRKEILKARRAADFARSASSKSWRITMALDMDTAADTLAERRHIRAAQRDDEMLAHHLRGATSRELAEAYGISIGCVDRGLWRARRRAEAQRE